MSQRYYASLYRKVRQHII